LPGVAYPGFRDNRSTLNTKTGFLKKTSAYQTRPSRSLRKHLDFLQWNFFTSWMPFLKPIDSVQSLITSTADLPRHFCLHSAE